MNPSVLDRIDGLFITDPINIRYLTGFTGVAPEEREAFCLLTQNQIFLFTNGLYLESAKNLKSHIPNIGKNLEIIEISREHPISKELSRVIPGLTRLVRLGSARLAESKRARNPSSLKNGSRIGVRDDAFRLGFEDTNLTVAELTKLKETQSVSLVPTRDRIENLRMIKTADEIANIKLAANVTDLCFKFIQGRIRPGTSESRLAWDIEGFLRYRAGGIAFSPIVAFNEHSSKPHYADRSNNPLKKGTLILLDFGAKVNGYCADMTRILFFGTPKDEWVNSYAAVLAAHDKAIALLKEGERNGATLDAAAREVIAEANLPVYPHSLGHAVGLAIHESPRLTVRKSELLSPNMAVTVEPGVYVEGAYGIRIEDLVLIKKDKIEILSKSPKELIVV